jgi:hypothetical protein
MKHKIKNFINHLKHKYKVVITWLNDLHIFLGTATESRIYENWKTNERTLYSMFFGWLLETLLYGLIISIAIITFGIKFVWFYPLTIGLLIWVCIDIIDRITKTIRRK